MNDSIKRIVLLSIVFLAVITISVLANKSDVEKVEVIFPDGSKTFTLASPKTSPKEILDENKIVLLDDEVVRSTSFNDKEIIYIDKKDKDTVVIQSESLKAVSQEKLKQTHKSLIEKIEIEKVEIPFETVTRKAKNADKRNSKIIQVGKNGLKELKYKTLYSGKNLIDKELIEEKIIKKPTNKIVQLMPKITSRSLASSIGRAPMSARAAFERIAAEKGISDREKRNWAALINKESSWNVRATNRTTGAYGLAQAFPGHKMASVGADWRSNPYTQLKWMYKYMNGRYGGINNAWGHSQRTGWY